MTSTFDRTEAITLLYSLYQKDMEVNATSTCETFTDEYYNKALDVLVNIFANGYTLTRREYEKVLRPYLNQDHENVVDHIRTQDDAKVTESFCETLYKSINDRIDMIMYMKCVLLLSDEIDKEFLEKGLAQALEFI